jgi:hypothetical protein
VFGERLAPRLASSRSHAHQNECASRPAETERLGGDWLEYWDLCPLAMSRASRSVPEDVPSRQPSGVSKVAGRRGRIRNWLLTTTEYNGANQDPPDRARRAGRRRVERH